MPLSLSTYRDNDDGDDNDTAPSEVSLASSKVVTAPPMSTFQALASSTATSTTSTPAPRQRSNFRTLTTFANNNNSRQQIEYDDDIGGFTEGHFVDEQMDRDDYLNNMDQFTQQSNNIHSISSIMTSSLYPLSRSKKRRKSLVLLLLLAVALGLALLLAFVLPLMSNNTPNKSASGDDESSSGVTDTDNATSNNMSPTQVPSILPAMPTFDDAANNTTESPPQKHPQQQLDSLYSLAKSWSGETAFDDSTTPSARALQWLAFQDPQQQQWLFNYNENDDVQNSERFLQQRYVSAVLYYALALDGNAMINQQVFNGTFLSGADVCLWNTLVDEDQPGGDSSSSGDTTRGILCDTQGIIRELQLYGLGAEGTLPMEISLLTSLVKLNLEGNKIGGSIPAKFATLTELESIDIRNCSLTGSLPSELSMLDQRLEAILLANNELTGSIPPSWGALTRLQRLDLAFNDLAGTLPSELSTIPLQMVRLNGNAFSGSLDSAFCTENPVDSLIADCLDSSMNVDCGCCTFCCNSKGLECTSTAAGPGDIGGGSTLSPEKVEERTKKLQALLEPISGTALQDPDSHRSNALQWMAQSDLNPNDLDDIEPVLVIQKYVMVLIYVATEGVSWKYNDGWMNGTDICGWSGILCDDDSLVKEVNLQSHNMIGTLVSEIGALASSLQSLVLKDNSLLTGDIPSEIGLLTSLSSLDVSECQFARELPSEIGLLANVSYFNINDNVLSGSLPTEMYRMANVKFMSLGANAFTGEIPAGIAAMSSLDTLKLSGCRLSGSIPSELGGVSSLSYLDLSGNNFEGSIPSDLGSLSELEKLYIDGNAGINGTVPEALAFLPRLKEFSVHGTAVIGNLDLLFCTGEVEEVTANCLDPSVICTCCALCCDVNGEKCMET